MIETTAVHLSTKIVDRFAIQSPGVRNQFRVQEARQLESKYEYDDMAELSGECLSSPPIANPRKLFIFLSRLTVIGKNLFSPCNTIPSTPLARSHINSGLSRERNIQARR